MKDNFSKQAGGYSKYRPTYPQKLYDFIIDLATGREAAWDCGTGNGQSAKELSTYFKNVFATDISQQQIFHAAMRSNIHYSVQPAEKTNFKDNTFDLITVAQAIHWFRHDEFYKEVIRVAKPGAVFATWGYSLLHVSPQIDELISKYHFGTLNDYWDPERKFLDEEYRNLPFPFKKIETPVFSITHRWTLQELEGYLNTWSALQKFIVANNYNPVEMLIRNIKPFWTTNKMTMEFPIHLLVARVEE